MKMKTFDSFWQRGKKFLGFNYSIIASAITWTSDNQFVSTVSNGSRNKSPRSLTVLDIFFRLDL